MLFDLNTNDKTPPELIEDEPLFDLFVHFIFQSSCIKIIKIIVPNFVTLSNWIRDHHHSLFGKNTSINVEPVTPVTLDQSEFVELLMKNRFSKQYQETTYLYFITTIA